ncbi:MAG: TolC family protein, partial [Saprospiraceae bacterium]
MDYLKSILFLLLSYSSSIDAQDFKPLILHSWAHSNELKAKTFQLQSALSSLQEAQSMYGPTVVLGGQYTLAAGGRNIEFPVGDLLNPAYSTLNQLTMTNAFPRIDNVNEQFLPNNFYDLRFRVTQPIYYPDIAIGKKIKSGLADIKRLEIKAYKRVLARDIMNTCIQIKTLEYAFNALLAADTLLWEAKRSTQSLIKNGVALPTALSKIETQLSTLEAQKIDVLTQTENALAYLRHQTGKHDVATELSNINIGGYPNTLTDPSNTREEISQLDKTIEVQRWASLRENMYYRPKLGLQMDVGSQAFDFGFSPYAL